MWWPEGFLPGCSRSGPFLGALGRENSFLLRTGEETFHVPTDLLGLTELRLGPDPWQRR